MKKILTLFIVLVFIYITVIMLGCSSQTKLIFHPNKLDRAYKYSSELEHEEVFLSTGDGNEINGLFFPDSSNNVILYFHGNAGSLDSWQYVYNDFRSLGLNFFIIDYRGFGKSTGKISEEGLYIDAQTAYNYLLERGFKQEHIIIYGRSIGTGVAVDLASRNASGALILESPFTNLKKLVSGLYPYLLPSLFLKYEFNNIGKINKINTPLLIIHGKRDNVIPFKHGLELYQRYQGEKVFLPIENGQHNNLNDFPEFREGVGGFLF